MCRSGVNDPKHTRDSLAEFGLGIIDQLARRYVSRPYGLEDEIRSYCHLILAMHLARALDARNPEAYVIAMMVSGRKKALRRHAREWRLRIPVDGEFSRAPSCQPGPELLAMFHEAAARGEACEPEPRRRVIGPNEWDQIRHMLEANRHLTPTEIAAVVNEATGRKFTRQMIIETQKRFGLWVDRYAAWRRKP